MGIRRRSQWTTSAGVRPLRSSQFGAPSHSSWTCRSQHATSAGDSVGRGHEGQPKARRRRPAPQRAANTRKSGVAPVRNTKRSRACRNLPTERPPTPHPTPAGTGPTATNGDIGLEGPTRDGLSSPARRRGAAAAEIIVRRHQPAGMDLGHGVARGHGLAGLGTFRQRCNDQPCGGVQGLPAASGVRAARHWATMKSATGRRAPAGHPAGASTGA